jgi:hypothetical protein
MHAVADAAPFHKLCDVHAGGDSPMALHASRIHLVMVHAVQACSASSYVTAQKLAGSGPLSSCLQ